MCQCSSKEKPVALRPHHGMCLAYFVGKGYSDGFTIHMEEMLEKFLAGASVQLTLQEDEICSACPNNLVQGCEAGRKVQRFDRSVLAYCGFEEGQQLPFREFVEKVQEKILTPGKRTEICGDCQWGNICDQVKSRWE